MSQRTLFLARLIGLYCILVALSMLLRGRSTVDTVELLLRDAPLMFVLGAVTLCAGLAIVVAHNIWSGGALAVIVTLVGWLAMIKGLLFLILTPEAEAQVVLTRLHYKEFFHAYAAISLVAGIYLAYAGFRKRPRP